MDPPKDHSDYWPCACVKHNRAGVQTHIKLHHRTVTRCRKCKCERPEQEWFDQQRPGHSSVSAA